MVEGTDPARLAAAAEKRAVLRRSGPLPPGAEAAAPGVLAGADSGRAWFATAAHCRRVADRIIEELRHASVLHLVIGDPPPALLSAALTEAAAGRPLIAPACDSDFDIASLRPPDAVAAQSGSGLLVTRLRQPAPLILLEQADRLSDPQMRELLGLPSASGAALVFVAGVGFGRRLAAIAGQPVASLKFEELSEAEVAGFIRHQLGPRDEFPPEVVAVIARAAAGDPALVNRLARLVRGLAADPAVAPTTPAPANLSATAAAGGRIWLYAGLVAAIGAAATAAAVYVSQPPPAATAPVAAPEIAALIDRGNSFRAAGDIASARLFFERAAEAGDPRAALLLGDTWDPALLARAGVRGVAGDVERARFWYRRAQALGDPDAAARLDRLAIPPTPDAR